MWKLGEYRQKKERKMSRSSAFYGLLITTAAAFVIGVAALILASINASNGNDSTTLFFMSPSILLSVYGSGSQHLSNGGGAWHHVAFDQHIPVEAGNGVWLHEPGSDIVYCNRTGSYSVYFSVQAQVNVSGTSVVPLECQACNLRYAIRGTQQSVDTETIFEIPGSFTYSSGQNFFLSKQFFIQATVGDIFRFDVISPCATLTLFPDAYIGIPTSSAIQGTYPSSTTLIISL